MRGQERIKTSGANCDSVDEGNAHWLGVQLFICCLSIKGEGFKGNVPWTQAMLACCEPPFDEQANLYRDGCKAMHLCPRLSPWVKVQVSSVSLMCYHQTLMGLQHDPACAYSIGLVLQTYASWPEKRSLHLVQAAYDNTMQLK